MEKLIELLTEYKPQADLIYKGGIRKGIPWDKDVIMNKDLLIISKQFWFIKRLVDNYKINYSQLVYYEFDELERFIQRKHNALLMLLAISENPIDFLCEILKQ